MNINKYFSLAKENGIDEIEIKSQQRETFSVSLFRGEIENYTFSSTSKLTSRGIFNGKMGFSQTEKDDSSTLLFLINQIKESASNNELDDKAIIFKGSEKYKKRNFYNKELDKLTPEDKIALLHKIDEKIKSLDNRICDINIAFEDSKVNYILANSHGLNLKEHDNSFYIVASCVAKDGDEVKTAYLPFVGTDLKEFDLDSFANKLVTNALSLLHGTNIKNGTYKMVFSKKVCATLINNLLSHASSEAVQKNTSLFKDKLNTQVISDKLTISEEPLKEKLFYSYFDDEGVAKYNKVIIDKGVLKTYFYNLETALKDGVSSTANGRTSEGSKSYITYDNIVIKNGRTTFDGLLKKVNKGIYISEVTGLHAGLDANSGDFSLQSEGYAIENGKITHALGLFTISGNLFTLFNNVLAVGNDSELLVNSFKTPSIAFKGIKYQAS
ncbi:MAG: TldD/PmbA family protein [Firmicutes bacterium]|uniref:TldD/PmbA family protein n=1 Tax=Candidatus Onthovivens merdipullorum TaxID=2840889 RepID=A0A9D9DIF0_9BACL|nr:TldD/PmbA family protein [Candidatus Onthovivens merdipullorum]